MNLAPFPPRDSIRALRVHLPGFPALICSNMFVLGNGPLTLIDSAPKFPGSFSAMDAQLKELGFTWNDVERIVITHGHIDHFGLVGMIRREARRDIPCYIHEDDRWRLSGDYLRGGMWSEEADRFYTDVDMPVMTVGRMKRRSHFFKNLCDPIDDAIPLKDGDVIPGDTFDLVLIHTPGHSTGCSCLYELRSRILFSGDHILKHITPNPFHEVNRSRLRDPSYKSLKSYMESLAKVERLEVSSVFPSHGEHIDDLLSIIRGYREHHERRAGQILAALRGRPSTIYALISRVFPDLDESESFLAVSEILVHLEILMEQGRVAIAESGPPVLYRAV
jgi:glyoxylase-like metal-dependent hydrolase (beta-lactamase superfamily II)